MSNSKSVRAAAQGAAPLQVSRVGGPVAQAYGSPAANEAVVQSRHVIWRLPNVLHATGYQRTTFYNRIKKGLWPRPVSLGERAVGWPASECEAMIVALIAGKSDEDTKALVAALESARSATV